MERLSHILATLSAAPLLALCLGAVIRRKVGQCYLFFAYIAVATTFSVAMLVDSSWYTPEVFVAKQGIYDSLLFGMALELSYRVFAAFRGIASRVRAYLAFAVTVSSVLVFLLTPANPEYENLGKYQPGITTAGLWCLTFVALLIVWYQIPVPAFTRAIFLGYVPYLLVFVVYLDMIARLGWGQIQNLNVLNAGAYDAAIGYLAFVAWQKE